MGVVCVGGRARGERMDQRGAPGARTERGVVGVPAVIYLQKVNGGNSGGGTGCAGAHGRVGRGAMNAAA